MSRAKRSKKSNGVKIWLPILCIVIVAITFFMIHDMQRQIDNAGDIDNSKFSANEVVDGEDSIQAENVIENDVNDENVVEESNVVSNETSDKTEKKNTTVQNNTQSQPATAGITDKKQKAIELVKKEWGADDTVDYVFDYVNENGEYVIAVKDRATATVRYYFRVNLETETVELD